MSVLRNQKTSIPCLIVALGGDWGGILTFCILYFSKHLWFSFCNGNIIYTRNESRYTLKIIKRRKFKPLCLFFVCSQFWSPLKSFWGDEEVKRSRFIFKKIIFLLFHFFISKIIYFFI